MSREFRYYFAQREAVETIIYLYEVVGAKDKYDLLRFDTSGEIRASLFQEDWLRFVVKMATGSGKTKVLSLVLAWSFFHKLYEPESELSRNFLVIAPNIIVLDRLRKDFDGLRIFFSDPVLPENGFEGRNWRGDFQLTVHIQDDVRVTRPTGNIFLTNIHRVYAGSDTIPSPDDDDTRDYFLGKRPTGATTDSKTDLGVIVRDIDELVVLNDEAHHIHDKQLAWFKCIEDIHNQLKQKGGALSLQVDTTATPKHSSGGAIFVQTITDYPLVEAIAQNVVKHPVLPDEPSRVKLKERQSSKYSERYEDYLQLGVEEWRKADAEHRKMGKKSILFVMTDDTRNCDDVATHLEGHYHDLENAVLVIHTKQNGEISEADSNMAKKELDKLRKQANEIDGADSPYKAIVSVLVLKEGWDVRNVTTVVGLRAYSSKSNILPEQTLGRGLRRMYPDGGGEETVSVIGTDAFMKFVEGLQVEGVVLERREMGLGSAPSALTIEVDRERENFEQLDIAIPKLSARNYRRYKELNTLDPASFGQRKLHYWEFSPEEQREIVFRDIATDVISHTTLLDATGVADWRNVIGYFARTLVKELRLVSGYDELYGKVKEFMHLHMFDREAHLEQANTLRNLAEPVATKALMDTFKLAINQLTVQDKGGAEISGHIRVSEMQAFRVKPQRFIVPEKSILNRITGDKSALELNFADFLDKCGDIIAYAKNYFAIGFRLDYVKHDGELSTYTPDFLVKASEDEVFIIETKGREELDLPEKMNRLKQWCEDVNSLQDKVRCDFVYVDEDSFKRYTPRSFADLVASFREYKDA